MKCITLIFLVILVSCSELGFEKPAMASEVLAKDGSPEQELRPKRALWGSGYNAGLRSKREEMDAPGRAESLDYQGLRNKREEMAAESLDYQGLRSKRDEMSAPGRAEYLDYQDY